jgi:hypothetical protein
VLGLRSPKATKDPEHGFDAGDRADLHADAGRADPVPEPVRVVRRQNAHVPEVAVGKDGERPSFLDDRLEALSDEIERLVPRHALERIGFVQAGQRMEKPVLVVDQLLVVLEAAAQEAPGDGMIRITDNADDLSVLDVRHHAAHVGAVPRTD